MRPIVFPPRSNHTTTGQAHNELKRRKPLNYHPRIVMTLHEDLLDLQVPESIPISPNKQSIVYSTSLPVGHRKGDYAVSTIWLAATGKTGSARQLTNGSYCDREPKWSPTGRSIAILSDRSKPGESSAIFILPLHGGEPYPVRP
jgi:WD40-like Beta Propeller Repeat